MLCKLITTQYLYFGENRFPLDEAERGEPRRDWIKRLVGHRMPLAETPGTVPRRHADPAHTASTMEPRPLS